MGSHFAAWKREGQNNGVKQNKVMNRCGHHFAARVNEAIASRPACGRFRFWHPF